MDFPWEGYKRMYNENMPSLLAEGKPGYSRIDFALAYASWIVHDAFAGGFSWKRIPLYRQPAAMEEIDWTSEKYEVEDPKKMSVYVKRAAKLFGASLVGICIKVCPYNLASARKAEVSPEEFWKEGL